MKKTYRMPQTTSVRFDVEGMLAASTPTSLGIFEDEDTRGSDGLSNERDLTSDSWSNTDED